MAVDARSLSESLHQLLDAPLRERPALTLAGQEAEEDLPVRARPVRVELGGAVLDQAAGHVAIARAEGHLPVLAVLRPVAVVDASADVEVRLPLHVQVVD
jgi:hypothetical protein